MRLFRLFMLWLTCLAVQGIELIARQLAVPRTWSGIPAERDQFPWQAAIMRRQRTHRDHVWKSFCGGALIAQNLVLTAAHCLVPNDRRTFMNKVFCHPKPIPSKEDMHRNLRVAIGHFYTDNIPIRNTDEEAQMSRILDYKYPENYEYPSNDVCILTTTLFERSDHVDAIPVAGVDIDYGHITCIVAGYGYMNKQLQEDPMESETLVWAQVKLLPKKECDKRLKAESQEIICIQGSKTGVAQGNSGSALVCNGTGDPREDSRRGLVVGIVLGSTQDGKTTVFTRISAHNQFLSEGYSAAQKMCSPKYCIFIGFAIISIN